MSTYGPAYDEAQDGERIRKQHEAIRRLMLDGHWRTLGEIAKALGYPEASVSAQLRHLRKPQFGSHTVEKQRRIGGLWEYRVIDAALTFDAQGQGDFVLTDSTYRGH